MKGIKLMLWMLSGVVAFAGLTSCEEEIVKYQEKKEVSSEQEKIYPDYVCANYFFLMYVYIEDESGNDLVRRWNELYQSQKFDEINYILTETQNGYIMRGSITHSGYGQDREYFILDANLACILKDDSITQTFKVFKNDVEKIVFNGKGIDYDDWDGKGAVIYKFKGVEIPIKKKIGETFYKDGEYYVDEEYISVYSEVTLVRHDDGTYTMKE